MDLYEAFGTDTDLELNGVWMQVGLGDDAPRILLARAGGRNTAYEKELVRATRSIRQDILDGTVDPAVSQAIAIEVFAKTIAKDWANIKSRQGTPLAFSPKAVVQLFTDIPDFFSRAREFASSAANYRKSAGDPEKALEGN